jgi:hypothetical protein
MVKRQAESSMSVAQICRGRPSAGPPSIAGEITFLAILIIYVGRPRRAAPTN